MDHNEIPVVLIISATDPTGGAGMATDIRVCQRNGVFPTCCVTAITVQNQNGLTRMQPTDPLLIRDQLEAIYDAVRPDAVKIGLLTSSYAVMTVADVMLRHRQRNIVLDPVLAPTRGGKFMDEPEAVMSDLAQYIFPQAELITPNIPEYGKFCDIEINGDNSWSQARNILLKGGHKDSDSGKCRDILFQAGKELEIFHSDRIKSDNLHGTGCFLSSAIASWLAYGYSLSESVDRAKQDLSDEIRHSCHDRLIPGYGPVFTP